MRMHQAKYLIAGASHAALAAVNAIRMLNRDGEIALVSRDRQLPYSPTVLPYVVSGRSRSEQVALRDEDYFARLGVRLLRGNGVAHLDAGRRVATLENGDAWAYEKLLLATGATPAVPKVQGLKLVPYHVLRTMDDAVKLNRALDGASSAVVLGAGLIGMHAAENLVKAGLQVTIVELQDQVLPGYLDRRAAYMIARTFTENGVSMHLGRAVVAARSGSDCTVLLEGGEMVTADLLMVCTGVAPVIGYLAGTPVETDRGVLVNEHMASSVPGIWAAGDVAQARGFYGEARIVAGIVPAAVEQGRVAGMAMIGDPDLKPYAGHVPLNTYGFFGHKAVSVGLSDETAIAGDVEAFVTADEGAVTYRKILFADGRLVGISGIDAAFDPGIMWQLILRRIDLRPVKDAFLAQPMETARAVMSRTWR